MKRFTRGFTLIEILVAVGIIAVMASLTLASMSGSRAKSRDTQRAADMGQYELAFKLSANKNGVYPTSPDPVEVGVGGSIDAELLQHIPSLPEAPSGGAYYYDSAYDCGGRIVPVIYTTMETSGRGNLAKVCGSSSSVPEEEQFVLVEDTHEFTGGGGGGPGPGGWITSCTLDASPSTIDRGQSTTLSWTINAVGTPVVTKSINHGVGVVTGSSVPVSPNTSRTYILTASTQGSFGTSVTCSDTVTVQGPGCMDPAADNYDANADYDDGSCIYRGCTDPAADNYWAQANQDDGSCIYPGCTNPAAENYNPSANLDDGTCIISGCMDPSASNYNSAAFIDDDSCVYGPGSPGSGVSGSSIYIIVLE